MIKPIYGLNDAPKAWRMKLRIILHKCDFRELVVDQQVYVKHHNAQLVCILSTHVGDLKGAGDHFMAGGDVKGMGKSIERSSEEIRKEFILRIHDLHTIMFAMRRMPKPIIHKPNTNLLSIDNLYSYINV